MLCLSIRQPWANLAVYGLKTVENRTWIVDYRGPILIHASKSQPRQEYEIAQQFMADRKLNIPLPPVEELPLGGIVGIADLTEITTGSTSPWAFPEHYHWIFKNPRPLKFHPCKGQQGLFPANHPDATEILEIRKSIGYGFCHQCSSPIRIPGAEAFECPQCGWVKRPRANVLGEVA